MFTGVIWNLHNWKNARRFALMSLRDFGMGKKSMAGKIQEESQALCKLIEEKNGQRIDCLHINLQHAVSNVISSVIFGNR